MGWAYEYSVHRGFRSLGDEITAGCEPPPAWVLELNSGPLKQYALISPVLWLGFWSVYMLSKQEISLGQVPSPYVTH